MRTVKDVLREIPKISHNYGVLELSLNILVG